MQINKNTRTTIKFNKEEVKALNQVYEILAKIDDECDEGLCDASYDNIDDYSIARALDTVRFLSNNDDIYINKR